MVIVRLSGDHGLVLRRDIAILGSPQVRVVKTLLHRLNADAKSPGLTDNLPDRRRELGMRPDKIAQSRTVRAAHWPVPLDEPARPVRVQDHLQLRRIESPIQWALTQCPQPCLKLGYLVIGGDLHCPPSICGGGQQEPVRRSAKRDRERHQVVNVDTPRCGLSLAHDLPRHRTAQAFDGGGQVILAQLGSFAEFFQVMRGALTDRADLVGSARLRILHNGASYAMS